MLTIQLKDLIFRAFHGVYPEEGLLGGDFLVNVTVDYHTEESVIFQLDQTLNYEHLFELVKRRMEKTTPLLETLAMEMALEILEVFGRVLAVLVVIEKKNPPIPGLLGSVVVSYSAKRD